MDTRERLKRQIDEKRAEHDALQKRIETTEIAYVRLALKKQRAALTGQIARLRQALMAENLKADEPEHVPRETFGERPTRATQKAREQAASDDASARLPDEQEAGT